MEPKPTGATATEASQAQVALTTPGAEKRAVLREVWHHPVDDGAGMFDDACQGKSARS